MSKTAKLFKNGASQAVRLPSEFRFEGDEVFISRDPVTGNVVLSSKAFDDWDSFFELRSTLGARDDFMATRPTNTTLEPRKVF
jgi:antitoxin VapB